MTLMENYSGEEIMDDLPSKKDFQAYEKVRAMGLWNMWAPEARTATGLSQERYLAVLSNFDALVKQYPDVTGEDAPLFKPRMYHESWNRNLTPPNRKVGRDS